MKTNASEIFYTHTDVWTKVKRLRNRQLFRKVYRCFIFTPDYMEINQYNMVTGYQKKSIFGHSAPKKKHSAPKKKHSVPKMKKCSCGIPKMTFPKHSTSIVNFRKTSFFCISLRLWSRYLNCWDHYCCSK